MMSQNRACSEISSDLFGRIHNKSQISGSEIHDRRPGLANRSSTPQTGRQLAGDRSKDVRCTTDALRPTVCLHHVQYTTTCLTLHYCTVPFLAALLIPPRLPSLSLGRHTGTKRPSLGLSLRHVGPFHMLDVESDSSTTN